MFDGEANVSVGQLNQASNKILFAACHGPWRRRSELFKAHGCLISERFSSKETAESFKIIITSSMISAGERRFMKTNAKIVQRALNQLPTRQISRRGYA